jgi:hypothetical protein
MMQTKIHFAALIGILFFAPLTRPGRAAALSEDDATYYFNLFSTVAYNAAIDEYWDLYKAVLDLDGYLDSFAPPGAKGLDYEDTAAEALYGAIKPHFALVEVSWSGGAASPVSSPAPLQLAQGLERPVLIEITNQDSTALSFKAKFGNLANSNTALTPAGATRAMLAMASSSNLLATQLTLTITEGRANTSTVNIPISVSLPATIRGTIIDSDLGEAFPGRVYVKGSDQVFRHAEALKSNQTVSEKAIVGVNGKNYKLPFFYSDGAFEIAVPSGSTEVTLERGYEHDIVSETIALTPGETRDFDISSGRFINMREMGWISGDTHIHWAKNWWNEDEDIELLALVQRAEDLQVANNLTLRHVNPVNGEFIAPTQFPMGPVPGHSAGDYIIQMAEEYRNAPFYGHLNFLNITELVQPISTGDLMGPDALDYPTNYSRILEARAQGGIVIAAHGLPGDAPANIAEGVMDSLDQSNPPDYYRVLNCGFRMPITDGSDHPARLAGQCRAYVRIDGPMSYAAWIKGIRGKKTFVSSGPLLQLTVNGKDIGEELLVDKGDTLRIRAKALSRKPIGRFQIVSMGAVIHDEFVNDLVKEVDFEITAHESQWIVARCTASPNVWRAVADYGIAHTSAVYVLVDGKRIFRASDAQFFANQMRSRGLNCERNALFENGQQRQEAVAVFERGAAIFDEMQRSEVRTFDDYR